MALQRIRLQETIRRERLKHGPIADAMAGVKYKIAIISGRVGWGKPA